MIRANALLALLLVSACGFEVKSATDATPAPEAKVERDGGTIGDRLGSATALSTNLMAVGAPGRDRPVTVDDELEETPDAGAVILFDLSSGQPVEVAEIDLGMQARWGDEFGTAVALDDTTLIVGAPGVDLLDPDDNDVAARDVGAVYVYSLSGTTATFVAEIRAPDPRLGDRFGSGVSLFGDRLAIGAEANDAPTAPGRDVGAVYLYQRNGNVFELASTSN